MKLYLAIMLPLLLLACSAAIPAPVTFSDKTLLGKYKLTATISPYAKFGGGPQLGSGEVNFDGAGKLSGWQTYWGQAARLKLSGTYHVNPDGIGEARITVASQGGGANTTALALRVENADRVRFAAQGARVSGDWSSANVLEQDAQGGVTGVFIRQGNPAGANAPD